VGRSTQHHHKGKCEPFLEGDKAGGRPPRSGENGKEWEEVPGTATKVSETFPREDYLGDRAPLSGENGKKGDEVPGIATEVSEHSLGRDYLGGRNKRKKRNQRSNIYLYFLFLLQGSSEKRPGSCFVENFCQSGYNIKNIALLS
jgi:hypothetical protein